MEQDRTDKMKQDGIERKKKECKKAEQKIKEWVGRKKT